MTEKIKDRFIGLASSAIVTLAAFLFFNYFSSFVTMAQYNKDKIEWLGEDNRKEVKIEKMQKDIEYIREKIDAIYRKTR